MSERLTEAESGSESQLDINRKREAEMAKLRKLLEEVHTESEQQIHTLRTKHQTSMMELQEQIERMSRDKEKVVKTATLTELGWDSLDIVECVMALEEGFDVELPDEETTTLKNVGDVMDLIQCKL